MLRKRYSINSRHRKNSPAPLTVTTRPRGLERPRRRRRSEPFSTPKRHFLTENGRPARPLEDPSCTQRQACKVEPRAWEAQAEPCSMERAASLNCTCTLRLRQKATLIFPVVAAHLRSHASIAHAAKLTPGKPASVSSHSIGFIFIVGRPRTHVISRLDFGSRVYLRSPMGVSTLARRAAPASRARMPGSLRSRRWPPAPPWRRPPTTSAALLRTLRADPRLRGT